MSTQTIGIDTAKRVFFLHGEDARGKVVLRERLTRERLLPFLVNQPASLIAIEAGCGAHHWARAFARLGHEVRLIHSKFVRPFVKTNKNDWNDAAAICEAVQRPTMRFLATKSLEQQDLLASTSFAAWRNGSNPTRRLYVRRILIQGAHSILRRIDQREGPRADWLRGLIGRRGRQVAAVALANKNARIAWRLLSHESLYVEHPFGGSLMSMTKCSEQ